MAAPFPGQMNAFQVGSYFVNNYYHMLQNRPDMVYQFYNNASTMVRLDVSTMAANTATGMLQIHGVIMNLNLNGIEVKTAQFLDSWSGGILVNVSGFVQLKEWSKRRRFMQSFFLAPQEKGYFVLNDMIHFLDEEHDDQSLYHPTGTTFMPSGGISVPDQQEANYGIEEEIQPNEEPVPVQAEETGTVEPEEFISSVPEPEIEEEIPVQDPVNVSVPVSSVPEIPVQELEREPEPVVVAPAVPVRELVREPVQVVSREVEPVPVVGEQPKLSYASILRAKGQQQFGQVSNNPTPPKKIISEPKPILNAPLLEKPVQEPFQDLSIAEDEGESLSVYVGNLAPSTQVSDLENEFKSFGPIKPDGIAIRSRKETGTVFAFIDFEDPAGVQNAIKASPIRVNGRLLYIEERKPGLSRGAAPRTGRGMRGGAYPSEPSRRPFGGTRPPFNGYPRRNGQD